VVGLLARPSVAGLALAEARQELNEWRAVRRRQETMARELPGPCARMPRS
jgi:hypothetical protein